MPERHPGWVSGINDFEARLATGLLTTSHQANDALDPLRARSGIRDAAGNPGLVTLGTNTVTVNPFQAVIQDPARPALGPYLVTMDAAKSLPLTASDPSLGRIDLVIAEVDPAVEPGFTVRVVEGSRSATPQPPSVTNPLHLRLAQIQVPAGTAARTLTDTRQFTAALGGILPVRGAADLPAGGPASLFVYRLDTGALQIRSTSGWTNYHSPRGTWNPAILLNGWVNYSSAFAPAAFTITDDGWVHLRGLVRSGDITKPIFNLPTAYRPLYSHIFSVKIYAKEPARLDVTTAGNIQGGGLTEGQIHATWTSLDGVSFPTY